ncbi:unnamed protein product [Diplocarpon coronariae]
MNDAELNYPIHDKELLAIFRSFHQYKAELLGAQKTVHVYTDHKALEKLEYQIKWKGADEDLEWYPCSDAMTAPHAIRSFHLKNPQAKGPPRALSSWLRSYNDGVDDYRDLEDNTPMDTTARAQFFKRGG